jgi:hypothetical protein
MGRRTGEVKTPDDLIQEIAERDSEEAHRKIEERKRLDREFAEAMARWHEANPNATPREVAARQTALFLAMWNNTPLGTPGSFTVRHLDFSVVDGEIVPTVQQEADGYDA